MEQVPVFERVLGTFHISFGRVADEGLGVVPEVLPEDVQEAVRPAVGDGLYAIMIEVGLCCTYRLDDGRDVAFT